MKSYSGIGSRSITPEGIWEAEAVGAFYGDEYILRTGGARGADQAFFKGCGEAIGRFEIYIPWNGYENFESREFDDGSFITHKILLEAYEIAERFHPNWGACSPTAKKLHARNSHIILGRDLDNPVDLVVCWSSGTGGTEQGLRIARHYGIEIQNLYNAN